MDRGESVIAMLRITRELTPSQRLVVMQYAAEVQDPGGTVRRKGQDLAADIGMAPQMYSRVRLELVRAGWLREDENARIGNVRYYRLTAKADGPVSNVVPLQPA